MSKPGREQRTQPNCRLKEPRAKNIVLVLCPWISGMFVTVQSLTGTQPPDCAGEETEALMGLPSRQRAVLPTQPRDSRGAAVVNGKGTSRTRVAATVSARRFGCIIKSIINKDVLLPIRLLPRVPSGCSCRFCTSCS